MRLGSPPILFETATGMPGLVKHANPGDAAILHQQIGGELEFAKGNGRLRLRFQKKGAANLAAGRVAVSMQHATAAVRAFSSEGNLGAGAIARQGFHQRAQPVGRDAAI